MGRGKNKICGEFALLECASLLQVANLPQRNTHTDWRRQEHFFLVMIQDQIVLFAFILGDCIKYIYTYMYVIGNSPLWDIKIIIGSITNIPAGESK